MLSVGPFSKGFHLITNQVYDAVRQWPAQGSMHVFIQHTSAGLTINEDADITVRQDFELYFERLAPENLPGIRHDLEGPDDMPAHIKGTLTGSSVHVPIINGELALGTWQGIYLCEFRTQARKRNLIITVFE